MTKKKPQPPPSGESAPAAAPVPSPPAQAAESSPPSPAPPLDRLPVYYDGSRGPHQVTLRDPSRALRFDGPGLRMVPTADAQDLLTPAIGGGAYSRAIPFAHAADWRPPGLADDLADLAAAGEITVAQYQPAGALAPQPFLVLDTKTRRRLRKEVA